jgi:MoxR-like ATPase
MENENTFTENFQSQELNVTPVADLYERILRELRKVIIGQTDNIELITTALLSGGHILLEGVPGIAKTYLAKSLAKSIDSKFSRIQFTPDLMPSDILGSSVFNLKNSEFIFHKGPIFANIILIDEINRSPAKTQSALFEAMEESQATIEGNKYQLESPFFVIATQNPIEQEGTYKLPEAQLDRFLFKLKLTYPELHEEIEILNMYQSDFKQSLADSIQKVASTSSILEAKSIVEKVFIKPELLKYIAAIVTQTRNHADIYLGASPRASLAILKTSKAMAAINGRNFVTPDDIKTVALHVLNHRIILNSERDLEGLESEEVINAIIQSIEIPR